MKSVERLDWFNRRTFHHRQFSDVKDLLESKERQNIRISACLPTLNESSSIGGILEVIKEEMMQKIPLIDQLAIIDSRSSDGTVDIAKEAGVDVYQDDEILPECGKGLGKGEALWKSLYVLEGDIVVWIDSDIKNIHPRFIYGIIGPLLKNEDVSFVKGYYQRPIKRENVLYRSGGGRVTELVARPMINLFYPALSGLIQPLSGEYAGRRSLLETLPFFTGYGVEIGLLIDIYNRFGIDLIAQVDLVERVHNNQNLYALSKMSFGILQAVFQRLEEDEKITVKEDLLNDYITVDYRYGKYFLEAARIEVIERPPMIEIEAYKEKFPAN